MKYLSAIVLMTTMVGCSLAAHAKKTSVTPAHASVDTTQNLIAPLQPQDHKGDIVAVITAPAEVYSHLTRAIPIGVQLFSLAGRALPEKVILVTSFPGGFIGTKPIDNASNAGELTLRFNVGRAALNMGVDGDWREKMNATVGVYSQLNSTCYGSVDIKIRTQNTYEWVEKPAAATVVPTGTHAALKCRIRIRDQYGDPVPNLPCTVNYQHPDLPAFQIMEIQTDALGIATVSLPGSKHEGLGLFQIDTGWATTEQIEVTYKKIDRPLK